MAVRSQQTSTEEPTARGGTPIARRHLDSFRTPARIILGALFVAYSSIGTIVGVSGDLAPALAHREDGAILGYGIGIAVAALIFVAELLLAEVSLFWYIVVLVPDTWYTYRFSGWIGAIARAHITDPLTAMLATVVLTGLFALAVAYFGERLLFGKRRQT